MAKQQPIRIVIAGAGRRSYWAMQVMKDMPEFELAGVCDTVPARARFLMDELQLSHLPLFTTFAACLRKCEFDAVFIATHDGAHADVALPALKAGKYIYLEKPLEISAARCDAIVDADRRAGGKTFVGFNLRYAPLYATMHKLVDDGIVGNVLTIESNEFYDGGRSYFRRWNRLRRCGGGLWITKSTHDFDIIQWMAGAPVETVCAFDQLSFYRHKPGAALYCRDCKFRRTCPDVYDATPATFYGRWFNAIEKATGEKPDLCLYNSDKDTFDHGMTLIKFKSGAIATHTCNVVASFNNRTLRISGTEGCLSGDLEKRQLTWHQRNSKKTREFDLQSPAGDMHGGGDLGILRSFSNFARGRKVPMVRAAEAAVSVRIGLAANRSSDTGRVVSFPKIPHTC